MRRALLLENIDPVAVELLSSAGYEVEARPRSAGRGRAGCRAGRRRPARYPVQDPGDHGGPGAPSGTGGRGRLLHRHQPDRPRRRRRCRGGGVQRAVLQHPQRGGTGHRGDHQPRPAAERPGPRPARRRLGQVGDRQPRGPRADAGHRRLRQHRQPAVGAGRGPGHAGAVLRPGGQARAGQRRGAATASTSCSSARRP